MGKTAPDSPRSSQQAKGRICIVASLYNREYTDALVSSAEATLEKLAPNLQLSITRVPGAFEIPLVVEALASAEEPSAAIIALGVIIRGATAHADLIAESITQSLHRTSMDYLIPVIHEVLLVDDSEQAEARSLGDELNRGREAAESAIAMIEVMRTIEED